MAAGDLPASGVLSVTVAGRHNFDEALESFASEIGTVGPVCVRGGGTRWQLGGSVRPGTHEVGAPCGIVAFEPAEMTVRVRAGTPVAELHQALAAAGQRTSLPERPGGTVGGALAAGESGICRLGLGPVRDALLQARYVCADGRLATAGAGTVKNVSGFDLCRLLVGSLGTLGLLGEVLLRTLPVGEVQRWMRLDGADPSAVLSSCRTALSILWDGAAVWTLLDGYTADVDDDLIRLGAIASAAPVDVDGPPELPPHRWSCTPAEAASVGSAGSASAGGAPGLSKQHLLQDPGDSASAGGAPGFVTQHLLEDPDGSAGAGGAPGFVTRHPLQNPGDEYLGDSAGAAAMPGFATIGRFVAEIGVGVVHAGEPQPPRKVTPGVVELNRRVKERFDPSGRLNPGRDPLRKP